MSRPFERALGEAVDQALAKPRATAAITLVGFLGSLFAVVVNVIAGAIVFAAIFVALAAVFLYALRQRTLFDGPYALLEDETIWNLKTPRADTAVVTKRQTVRFNYQTFVIVDYAWGDGDQFHAYDPAYGKHIFTGQHGSQRYAIVALPDYRQRGEETTLASDRTVTDAFGAAHEWIELKIDKDTRRSKVKIRFPLDRPPRKIKLHRESTDVTEDWTDRLTKEGGRFVFDLDLPKPPRGELLSVRWDW